MLKTAIFNYPVEFQSFPSMREHTGQTVLVVRQLEYPEVDADESMEKMFEIQASDGWVGHAFESELTEVQEEKDNG